MSTINNLQRRLDRAAIDQLRAEVVGLHARLEAAEAHVAELQVRLTQSEEAAESWQALAFDAMDTAFDLQVTPPTIGISADGQLAVLHGHA